MTGRSKVRPFDFESRGVSIRLTSNRQELVDWAEDIARQALLNDVLVIEGQGPSFTSVLELTALENGEFQLTQDSRFEGVNADIEAFRRHLNSLVRVTVAKNVSDRMFMHAGAVAWKGRGIIFPGDSFVGKSTLVGELIKNGADYLSDDYAIFDENGHLYEFPRTLTIRSDGPGHLPEEFTAEELGARVAKGPIPVAVICLTSYEPDFEWSPSYLSAGQAVLEMVPYTFSFVNRPEFSLNVLKKLTEHAIIVSSKRGSADTFAKTFLNFIDKQGD